MDAVPEWIRTRKAEDERAKAQDDARLQQVLVDDMTVAANAKEFFQQLLGALDRNAEGLSEIGVFGKLTRIGKPGSETSCQLNVERRGLDPSLTYTAIHCDPGSTVIRCLTLEGQDQEAHSPLRQHPNGGIGVLYRGRVIDAGEFAAHIVQGMVEKVKSSR